MVSYSQLAKTFLSALREGARVGSEWYTIQDRCEIEGEPRQREADVWILSKFPDGWTINDFPYYPLIIVAPADVDFEVWIEGMGDGLSRVKGSIVIHLMHNGRLSDFDALSDEVFEFLRKYDWTGKGIYTTGIQSELVTKDVATKPTKFYHRNWVVSFEVVE